MSQDGMERESLICLVSDFACLVTYGFECYGLKLYPHTPVSSMQRCCDARDKFLDLDARSRSIDCLDDPPLPQLTFNMDWMPTSDIDVQGHHNGVPPSSASPLLLNYSYFTLNYKLSYHGIK